MNEPIISPDTPDAAVFLLQRAEAARAAGATDLAIEIYHALISAGMLQGWAWFFLGLIHRQTGNSTTALQALDHAIDADGSLFWAHHERITLAFEATHSVDRLAAFASAMLSIRWEPIQQGHVERLEEIGLLLWDEAYGNLAIALLMRMVPTGGLSRAALERLLAAGVNEEMAEAAREQLRGLPDIDPVLITELGNPSRRGDLARLVPVLERRRVALPSDFTTWLALVDAYAALGRRDCVDRLMAETDVFTSRQRALGRILVSFAFESPIELLQELRRYDQNYKYFPRYLAIVLTYRLHDAADSENRDDVVALLITHHADHPDVALLRVNIALQEKRWDDARKIFDATLLAMPAPSGSVRVAHVNLLASTGRIEEAAALVEAERRCTPLDPTWLQLAGTIFGELGRWEDVFEVGMAGLGAACTTDGLLDQLVRAARKTRHEPALFDALLSLPRPLTHAQTRVLYAVMEDLAEHAMQDVFDRAEGIAISPDRARRIRSKLRSSAGDTRITRDACIYFCADRAYLTPAFTSLTSLLAKNVGLMRRAAFKVVVDSDVVHAAMQIGQALSCHFPVQLEIVDASSILSSGHSLRTTWGMVTGGHSLSLAAYYRVLFAQYLIANTSFSQALYIDADTLVRGGLDELLDLPFNAPLMARPEFDGPDTRALIASHGLNGAYFNSGILRFDLTDPSLPGLLDRTMEISRNPDVKLFYVDQCALNIAFDLATTPLPARYNHFVHTDNLLHSSGEDNAVILHYTWQPKPWDSLYQKCANEWFEWYEFLKMLTKERRLPVH